MTGTLWAMALTDISGTIHLVRHGNVENPTAILYGRLPGFHLSELGRRQAEAAAERLADAGVTALWASPLERAQETAAFIAKHHGINIVSDDRLLESDTRFEGIKKTPLSILSPRNWWRLRNPLKPSWGESFADIAHRMLGAIEDATVAAGGGESVLVAHQTPVVVARNALAGKWGPPWLGRTNCETGSITTMVMEEGRLVSASYFVPSG